MDVSDKGEVQPDDQTHVYVTLVFNAQLQKIRKHSSRIHTTRSSSSGGWASDQTPSVGRPPLIIIIIIYFPFVHFYRQTPCVGRSPVGRTPP